MILFKKQMMGDTLATIAVPVTASDGDEYILEVSYIRHNLCQYSKMYYIDIQQVYFRAKEITEDLYFYNLTERDIEDVILDYEHSEI